LKKLSLIAFSILLLVPVGAQNVFAADPNESNTIFFGGIADFFTSLAFNGFIVGQSVADDFILESDSSITDVHFSIRQDSSFTSLIEDFTVIIYTDKNGLPDKEEATRTSVNVIRESLPSNPSDFRYWFDLNAPILLDGGVTYWIEIREEAPGQHGWLKTFFGFGNQLALKNSSVDWFTQIEGVNFVLSGDKLVGDEVVGGELLSIDSAALLLAGAQSFSWMIPVILSGIGIGLFFVSRKSE